MKNSDQAKAWIESAPLQVQEEIRQYIHERIGEGIMQIQNMRAEQRLLVDMRTNRAVQVRKSLAEDVLEFMIAMDQLPAPLSEFAQTPVDTLRLATQLMFGVGGGAKRGEVYEMMDAWDAFIQSHSLEHLTEFVDGAIDSIYVILWTLNKLGVPADACWKLVQDSNMAKLGPDGKPIKNPETGKIMKPEGWKPPDLFGLLAAASSGVTYVGGLARHD